jgi:methylated-DNA-protein-cysteine methyltransferase related protein
VNDFYQRVYALVGEIPFGRVTTYGTIARVLGAGRSSRLVGHALKVVPDNLDIPCHRVVNRNGELSGMMQFDPPELMRALLEAEGVTFDGEAVDMRKHYWDPEEG